MRQEDAPPGQWPSLPEPRQRLLLRHWALWREGLLPPPRSRIDPALIKPCLADLWIFRIADTADDLVCTLAGENIRETWGYSIIGARPVDLWGPDDGEVVRQRLLRVARTPGLVHGCTGITPRTGASKLAHRLMLPLADEAGQPYGVIGVTYYVYDRSRDPQQPGDATLQFTRFYACAGLPATPPPETMPQAGAATDTGAT